jgi:hypothetical protein
MMRNQFAFERRTLHVCASTSSMWRTTSRPIGGSERSIHGSMIKESALLGHTTIPFNSVEQRLHERQLVASRWFSFSLEGGTSDPTSALLPAVRATARRLHL